MTTDNQYISRNSFTYIWRQIVNKFVKKDTFNQKIEEIQDGISDMAGAPGGFATLDQRGKIPQSQLPNTATYETIIIYTTFNESTNTYIVDEESAEMLRNYTGEKTMFLYEPLGKLYIPYIGNNEFVIDVFGASIYFRVDLDTRICTFSVGEWVSLDENGEVPADKFPNIIIYGYYNEKEGLFYEDDEYEIFIPGNYKKFFVDLDTGTLYAYYGGKYNSIMTAPGSSGGNVKYIPDEDYEKLMKDLGI